MELAARQPALHVTVRPCWTPAIHGAISAIRHTTVAGQGRPPQYFALVPGEFPDFFIIRSRNMHWIKSVTAGAMATLSFGATANTMTDLWYNPAESGWGANIVQQDDIAFVTLFVYGPNGEPEWYGAPATRIVAYSSDGLPHFQGELYKTRGSWQGGPFDPASFSGAKVGEITLTPLSNAALRIEYSVNGVPISKNVVRQTWRYANIASNYVGAISALTRTDNGGVVREITAANFALYIDESFAFMKVDDDRQVRCDYRGAYTQAGRLGAFSGTFTCGDGRAGPFAIEELEVTNHGISGKIRSTWTAGSMFGRFGGPRR